MNILATRTKVARMGGPTVVGNILGITSQAVSQWKRIPIKWVPKLAANTSYTRHDLRPDVFEDSRIDGDHPPSR